MEPEELYAEIRRENTERALITGERWIVTRGGIPDRMIDATFVTKLVPILEQFLREGKEFPEPLGLTDVITGQRYDWDGMKELAKRLGGEE